MLSYLCWRYQASHVAEPETDDFVTSFDRRKCIMPSVLETNCTKVSSDSCPTIRHSLNDYTDVS